MLNKIIRKDPTFWHQFTSEKTKKYELVLKNISFCSKITCSSSLIPKARMMLVWQYSPSQVGLKHFFREIIQITTWRRELTMMSPLRLKS